MKKNNIEFREVKRSDYPALEKIIRDTWHYQRFCSPKTAQKLSKVYLASCLVCQDYTCVAVNDGKPVGVIMGKDERKHQTKTKDRIHLLATAGALLVHKEGRRVAKMFQSFNALDSELLQECGQRFDGELAFFAIDSEQRGLGIGKQLFDRVVLFMKVQGIKNFYLYTDDTCNFGFYEHQGMKRLNEKNHSLKPFEDKDIRFFLYGFALPKDAPSRPVATGKTMKP